MIVDFYTTFGPSLANHDDRLIRPLVDATTAERMIAILDRVGIDRAIVFPPRPAGAGIADSSYQEANRAVAAAVAAHPERLIGYARVNPNFGSEALAEAEHCFDEYKCRGLMLDPEWDNFEPQDEKNVYPIVDAASRRGLPVLVECSWSPISPATYWRLAEDFSETAIVLAHMGFRLQDDAVNLVKRLPNVYLETSDHMYYLGHVTEAVGADRVLFGSNTPFSVPEAELLKVTLSDHLDDTSKQLILGENAARLHSLL